MAQPNVVREPSMDEILASIRRIIESNEPVIQSGVATSMAEPEGFSGRPANDDSEEVTLTVDDAFIDRNKDYEASVSASSSMLRAIAGVQTHSGPSAVSNLRHPDLVQQNFQPVQPPQKALSLADVAARVRAASERTSMVMRELGTSQPEQVEQPVAAVSQPIAPVAAPVFVAEEPQARQVVEQVRQPVAEVSREFVADTRVLPMDTEIEEESSYRAEPVSILSSSAGEQVARSFQDLALALEDAQRRSLDQIAEDMMRPMLQEWLDDNLPTLVERLVREEIERVARGPRR